MGGLLSAYDLSGDEVFLRRTRELVDLMLPAMGPADSATGAPPRPQNLWPAGCRMLVINDFWGSVTGGFPFHCTISSMRCHCIRAAHTWEGVVKMCERLWPGMFGAMRS